MSSYEIITLTVFIIHVLVFPCASLHTGDVSLGMFGFQIVRVLGGSHFLVKGRLLGCQIAKLRV